MASGLESLLEALQNSGMNTEGIGGKEGASSAGSGSAGNGGGNKGRGGKGGDVPHIDFSFLEEVHGPKSKAGWIILAVVAVLVIAGAYWWFHPAISLNSVDLWIFIGLVCLILAGFFYTRRMAYKNGQGKFEKSPSKEKRSTILMAIPLAVIVVGVLGAVMSNAIIPGNAEKYSNVLQTDTLDFAQDIPEVNYSEIPVIDRVRESVRDIPAL